MKDFQKKLIEIRRHIHAWPELGNLEFKTSKFILSILKSLNIDSKRISGTGVLGIIGASKNRPCVGLRADMDALPVEEKNSKPYKSRNPGVMHACGHDANTAIVIGAAMLLSEKKPDVRVKFIFQPNEENAGGAEKVIASGALIRPRVDAIFGVHVSPQIPAGKIGVKSGEMMAAVDRFSIEISGGGGHAAYPHLGKDTVLASVRLISNLHNIVSRKIDPTEPAVISVCTINGGARFNILAEKVVIEGTARSLNEKTRNNIKKLIIDAVRNIANTDKLKYKIKYENLGCPLINNPEMVKLAVKSAEKAVGKHNIVYIDKPSMGGEDFAEYLKYAPGCFIYIGSRLKTGFKPWHHPEFDIDERALQVGAKVLAQIVLDFTESRRN